MDLNFYYCALEGRQLRIGETGILPCREVVRAICESDYQNKDLVMTIPKTKAPIDHEHVKAPKDGLFLMRVSHPKESYSLHVLFDTRTTPDFVMIEKREGMQQEGREVLRVLENSLSQAADQYGWKVRLDKNPMDEVRDFDLFVSAMEYVHSPNEEDPVDFRSFVKIQEKTVEIMALLHSKLDLKKKPQHILRILRAASDAGLTEKPERESFNKEFKKKASVSSYNRYMSDSSNPFANDSHYKDYMKQFLILMRKWVS